MPIQAAKSSTANNPDRCSHRFPNGMRCRLLGFTGQPFCPKHTQPASAPPPLDPAEIAASLTYKLDDFTSAAQINDFLSRLLLLLAKDQIPTRRAAVLTYIASQLLRTLPEIDKENNGEPTIIVDIPGPDSPSPADQARHQDNATLVKVPT